MTQAPNEMYGSEAMAYDGFISYSHAADGLLAPRLQSALQRFAKPWWKRRGVRIFRDESSLSANPHLWSSIIEALDTSGWFVLLLSPDAARSEWVNQEIAYWVENRDPRRILPVVTDGSFGWSDGDVTGDAVPEALHGVFSEEPRWVDLRFARDEEQLDLKHAEFNSAIADIASTIRGVPKDELASEEVRQHRRTVRTAWAAGASLLALTVVAVGAAVFAFSQQAEANRQRDLAVTNEQRAIENERRALESERVAQENEERALAGEAEAQRQAETREADRLKAIAASVDETNPETAMLLLVQALTIAPPGTLQSDLKLRLRDAMLDYPVLKTFPIVQGRNTIALSSDGETIFHGSPADWTVRALDAVTGAERWVRSIEARRPTRDDLLRPPILQVVANPDGTQIAVVVSGREETPAQVIILRPEDGSVVATVSPGECGHAWLQGDGYSSDGRFFSVTTGSALCGDDRRPDDDWAVWFDTDSWQEAGSYAIPNGLVERVRLHTEPDRVVVSYGIGRRLAEEYVDVVDGGSGDVIVSVEGAWPTLSPAGGTLIYEEDGRAPEGFYQRGADLLLLDLASLDDPIDLGLDRSETPFADTYAIGNITQYSFSPDGSQIAVALQRSLVVMSSSGGKLHEFPHTSDAYDLAWVGDGSRLVTAHEDRLILWSVGPDRDRTAEINRADDWPSLALDLLGRSFTEAECLLYGIDPCPTLKVMRDSLG